MTDKEYLRVGLLVLGAFIFAFVGLLLISTPLALGFVGAVLLALAFTCVSMSRDKNKR